MKLIVENEAPLIDVLPLLAPDSSKRTLRNWIKAGRILVDGRTSQQANLRIQKGQCVEIAQKQDTLREGLRILHHDAHLVVVEKPAGLLSVSTHYDKEKTVHSLLKDRFRPGRVYVVHRLDRETSGVMVFALSKEGLEGLKSQFEEHSISREYIAVTEGAPDSDDSSWQNYLVEDANYVVHSTRKRGEGKRAITHYKVLDQGNGFCKLSLRLKTGRKNQIRVHCQEAGIPVAGDKKYGSKRNPIKRLCLHARRLGFIHPVTKKTLDFQIDPPQEFDLLLQKRRLKDA